MKKLNLISFTPQDFAFRKARALTIRVGKGKLAFSAAATYLMGLKEGQKLQIHQDADDTAVWYLSIEKEGFDIKTRSHSAYLHSKALCLMIGEAFGLDQGFNFLVSEEPVISQNKQYWTLTLQDGPAQAEEEEEEELQEAMPPKRRGRKPGSKSASKGRKQKEEAVEYFDFDKHGY